MRLVDERKISISVCAGLDKPLMFLMIPLSFLMSKIRVRTFFVKVNTNLLTYKISFTIKHVYV